MKLLDGQLTISETTIPTNPLPDATKALRLDRQSLRLDPPVVRFAGPGHS
jgi:hypothetical protein